LTKTNNKLLKSLLLLIAKILEVSANTIIGYINRLPELDGTYKKIKVGRSSPNYNYKPFAVHRSFQF
jgi:hypothetical protein